MRMTAQERTALLNKLLGGDADTEILDFILAKGEAMILNYCRLSALPEGLETLLLALCVDIFRAEQPGQAQASGSIKSVTEGDVYVSYSTATAVSENPAMDFLKDYRAQLNRYRKMGW